MEARKESSVAATVEAGAAVYSPRVLRIYDALVPRFFIPFVWGLPLRELRALYRRNLSANHLDVGIGTGFFLDEADFPAPPRLVLVDLNPNSLAHAGRRLARYEPQLVRASALDPLPLDDARFDSVAMNALLHCLPGPMERKAAAFDHAREHMNPGAALFGCTLMDEGTGPLRSWIQERFRRRGIFGNRGDGPEGLERELRRRFEDVRFEVRGAMAVFEARKARAAG